MVFSISAVLFLGALVLLLIRWSGLRVWHATVCALFGFYLATSVAAPFVREAVAAALRFLS